MQNWSADVTKFKTPAARERFELEQLINYGLGARKVSRSLLNKHWSKLALDPARRRLMALFLHDSRQT